MRKRSRSGSEGEEGEREARKFPVTIAGGNHLYPYRTQKLSLQTLMVLGWERPGRVGSRRDPKGAGETEVFPASNNKGERGRKSGLERGQGKASRGSARRFRWKDGLLAEAARGTKKG